MRDRPRPAIHVQRHTLVILVIESLALASDQFRKFIVRKVDDIRIERAAKDPGLRMRRAASLENRIIEKDASCAKALVTRKETPETLERSRSGATVKRRHRHERKHLKAP